MLKATIYGAHVSIVSKITGLFRMKAGDPASSGKTPVAAAALGPPARRSRVPEQPREIGSGAFFGQANGR